MKIRALLILTASLVAVNAPAQSYTNFIVPNLSGTGAANSIANQLNAGSNTLAEVLPTVPDGTSIYTYTAGVGFSQPIVFTAGTGWFDPNFPGGTGGPTSGPALVPGEGAFLVLSPNVPAGINLVFNGTTNVPVLPLNRTCGLSYFVNRQTVGQGTFENITGQSPSDGTQVFVPNPGLAIGEAPDMESPNYTVYTFCGAAWLPSPPVVPVGMSVFINSPCLSNTTANADPCMTIVQTNIVVMSTNPVSLDFAPQVTDNCNPGAIISIFSRPASGSLFMPGSTPVHCVAIDNAGNAVGCDFTVTLAPPPLPVPPPITIPFSVNSGMSLIAYPFIHGGNTLRELFPNVPDGTVASKFDDTAHMWLQSTFSASLGAWIPGNITLRPGEGAFINNPLRTPLNLGLSGQPNTPVLPINISNTIVLVSCQTNEIADFQDITGTNPTAGTVVFKWDVTNYDTYSFDGRLWHPSTPTAAIGESLWISTVVGTAGIAPPPIPIPPVITVEPVSVVAVKNADGVAIAQFSVQATGTAPLQYQWRLNGNPLLGQTNPTITINVRATNCGNYDVVVQNTIGIAQSTVATLSLAGSTNLPFNDFFAAAGAIPSTLSGTGISDNIGATVEPGEPSPGFIPGGASVWATWQAPSNGVATFSTLGSGFDTLLAIYTGTSVSNLTPIASDDDSGGSLCSLTSFNAQAGSNYYIQVDGFYGANGNITLNWDETPTTNTIPVIIAQPKGQTTGFGGSAQLSVAVQPGSPMHFQWFRNGLRIPGAIANTLNFANVGVPQVGVYQLQIINDVGGLSTLSLPAEIQINTPDFNQPVNTGARAETKLQAVMDTTVRPNDPYDPPIVTGYSGTEVFSSYNAFNEPDEPLHCGFTCYFTKWHSYTAPGTGLVIVANTGTTFAGVLGVYTGPDTSLVPLACSAGHGAGDEVVSFETTSNTTYWISMSGTNSNTSGTVELLYATYTAPLYTLLPMGQTDAQGGNVTLSVSTIGAPVATYQWQLNGTNIAGATTSTLNLAGFSDKNQGDYSVFAMNLAGTNRFSFAPVLLNSPPRFINLTNFGGFIDAQFIGIINSNYLFQSSTDNVNWVTATSGSSATGILNFSAPITNTNAMQLYRAVQPAPIQ